MRTEVLIDQLTNSVVAIPRHAAAKRLCAGLGLGALAALALLIASLGVRPDIAEVSGTAPFWMKWAFTLSLGWSSFIIVKRLARPGGRVGFAWWGLAAPIGVVALMGFGETMQAPAALREGMWLGRTAVQCPIAILLLSVPVFLGLVWAFRRLAPTRLRLGGMAAGLLAGSAGASIYVLTCPEHTVAFMATWYTAGVLAAGLAGALAGRRLLRW